MLLPSHCDLFSQLSVGKMEENSEGDIPTSVPLRTRLSAMV